MFFVFREKSPEIWKRKLDWIVRRGGMALVNVHPDYVRFGGSKTGGAEYPVAFYEQFLNYLQDHYAGQYWNALPREVARWYRQTCVEVSQPPGAAAVAARSLSGKRAAVVLYSYYASDPRPRRETEALQRAGMDVDVICLREHADEAPWELIDGVNVHRVPLKRRRAGKLTYAFQYLSFLVSSTRPFPGGGCGAVMIWSMSITCPISWFLAPCYPSSWARGSFWICMIPCPNCW